MKPGLLDGLAFGRRGREVLVLAGNPLLLGRAWNDMTRAVALHEMGHVVNDDIRSREVTRTMWSVLPVLALLAMAGVVLASLFSGEIRFPVFQPAVFADAPDVDDGVLLLSTLGKSAASFFVVWWIWAGLIRAREHYADHRVSSWGFQKPLLSLLQLPDSAPSWWRRLGLERLFHESFRESAWWGTRTRLWESYGWRRHPSKKARARALREPGSLFQTGADLAFLTGLLLALLGTQLTSFTNDLAFLCSFVGMALFLLVGPFAVLVYAALALGGTLAVTGLVTGALGIQVRREAMADLATRPQHHEWGYLRLARTALFFTLGLEDELVRIPDVLLELGKGLALAEDTGDLPKPADVPAIVRPLHRILTRRLLPSATGAPARQVQRERPPPGRGPSSRNGRDRPGSSS